MKSYSLDNLFQKTGSQAATEQSVEHAIATRMVPS